MDFTIQLGSQVARMTVKSVSDDASDDTAAVPPFLRLPTELRRRIFSFMYPWGAVRRDGLQRRALDHVTEFPHEPGLPVWSWNCPVTTEPCTPEYEQFGAIALSEPSQQDEFVRACTNWPRRAHRAATDGIVTLNEFGLAWNGLGIAGTNRQIRREVQDCLFHDTQQTILVAHYATTIADYRYRGPFRGWQAFLEDYPFEMSRRVHIVISPANTDQDKIYPNRIISLRERVYDLCKRLQKAPVIQELIIDARGPFFEVQEELESASAWILRRQGIDPGSEDAKRRNLVVSRGLYHNVHESRSDLELVLQPFKILSNVQSGYILVMPRPQRTHFANILCSEHKVIAQTLRDCLASPNSKEQEAEDEYHATTSECYKRIRSRNASKSGHSGQLIVSRQF
ncbi:uncharacterized protein BDZ99DRAFT_203465 [Mytilinidion resinicola]|uniref:F-box domain-containing protein n=1 Tax=Mytilinidion resinicola TaxID=574789 RepID=A0A6A6Y1B1_9PEZI|nr:uncharacterized protein BDZ99DRAFT_203465 [Mytilinidion resinicola]KAF2802429.1 hypothetical protein BDZ99DRAFT_203465 [Mytilinidion resinicola]